MRYSNKTEEWRSDRAGSYVEKDHSDYNVIWGPGWKQRPVGCHLSETSRRDGGASNRVSTDSWVSTPETTGFLMHAAAWNSQDHQIHQFTFQFHIRSVTDPSGVRPREGSPDWSHVVIEWVRTVGAKESCVFQWKNEGQARPLGTLSPWQAVGEGSFIRVQALGGRQGGSDSAGAEVCAQCLHTARCRHSHLEFTSCLSAELLHTQVPS